MLWVVAAGMGLAGPDGRVRVIDGDTLRVGGQIVRLFGIDAPERAQTCTRPDDPEWRCGAWATRAAAARFDGRYARCTTLSRDPYDRAVARCRADGQDIAAVLVRAGIAQAYRRYSRDYIDAEKEALVAGRGIWAADMQDPAAFRAATRQPAAPRPKGCAIKGNISQSGRIYHLPGQRDYGKTRISPARGERWFCSEAEARAAGWRRARR